LLAPKGVRAEGISSGGDNNCQLLGTRENGVSSSREGQICRPPFDQSPKVAASASGRARWKNFEAALVNLFGFDG
jgi:hypothetical protein